MLSDRIRPNSEAAPWVIEEVKALEQSITELESVIKSHGNQPDSEALKLARECGFAEWHGTDDAEFLKVIEAFYRAAFNAGLEAAANVCDTGYEQGLGDKYQGDVFSYAIRALKEMK